MFININGVNYFVLDAKQKGIHTVYEEIFKRSAKASVTFAEKREMLSQIKKQIKG